MWLNVRFDILQDRKLTMNRNCVLIDTETYKQYSAPKKQQFSHLQGVTINKTGGIHNETQIFFFFNNISGNPFAYCLRFGRICGRCELF